jgi:hypothetical protein
MNLCTPLDTSYAETMTTHTKDQFGTSIIT